VIYGAARRGLPCAAAAVTGGAAGGVRPLAKLSYDGVGPEEQALVKLSGEQVTWWSAMAGERRVAYGAPRGRLILAEVRADEQGSAPAQSQQRRPGVR